MPTVTSRFLLARFASMLGGFLLLVAGFLVYSVFADDTVNDLVRWLVGVATLAAALSLGFLLQHAVLARVDSDGTQRQAIRAARQLPRDGQ